MAPVFSPLLDPPDRIPAPLPENLADPSSWSSTHRRLSFSFHGCRHGIALLLDHRRNEAVLWDPLTGVQRRVCFPPGLGFAGGAQSGIVWNAAVLRTASADDHDDCRLTPFKLVLACRDDKFTKEFVCLYESNTGVWGDVISITTTDRIGLKSPSVLVGNTLCWLVSGGGILEFDFERQTLVVIDEPTDLHATDPYPGMIHRSFQILRGEDGGLGLAVLSDSEQSIQLWARKSDSDGVGSWVLRKTVQLDERFSRPEGTQKRLWMPGYDEDTNAIFLSLDSDDFMLQLESMQFTCLHRNGLEIFRTYHPYAGFYTAGRGIAGGDGGAENVNA